jgi:tetratricopeptide (TPR) repeat protein
MRIALDGPKAYSGNEIASFPLGNHKRNMPAVSTDDEAQLKQTIEMFEVIVQSQPNDCQSLEILKEAYKKLGREQEVVATSKRIAQAYMQLGQLSSAILEFETVLQQSPNDADVHAALKSIQETAGDMSAQPIDGFEPAALAPMAESTKKEKESKARLSPTEIHDGKDTMRKIFVDSKIISAGDFDLCWRAADLTSSPTDVVEPFVMALSDKKILPVEKALKILTDKSRLGYLPLDKYDVDIDLTRGFPADVCRRWCVLPFDRMSKAMLVATANPFNQQAAKELAQATTYRLLWYVSSPTDLVANLRKAFR